MIIPEDIEQQPEIQEIEIPSFLANKRIIGMSTIIQELANNYLNGNAIWSYYSLDQLMIYSNSRELRQVDMDEVQKWILFVLKPEEQPITRALKKGFISNELLTRYCKLIGHKYLDHICSKCNGEDNHTENREKTSIQCHPNVETSRQGKTFWGINTVETLIRRKYPLKYDTSSDRRT
ncbi:hypothetical protein H5410_015127 [Solanum commersonii]|uniref:Uncharacterized protein n=1 Tax=Solanum commersonii TaxID=4109 RepID=A0A9J5ZTI9_SOLCO|nr:hypothetical protein H5410_015127 [Solanum commersonii]